MQNTILLTAHDVLEEERKKMSREIVSLKVQRDLAVSIDVFLLPLGSERTNLRTNK